jgi:hypothetical protein
MTIYGGTLGGSTHPYGKAKKQSLQESTTLQEGIDEPPSIEELTFLVSEQKRLIKHLRNELTYYKGKSENSDYKDIKLHIE